MKKNTLYLKDLYNVEKIVTVFLVKSDRNIRLFNNFIFAKDGFNTIKYSIDCEFDKSITIEYDTLTSLAKLYDKKVDEETLVRISYTKNNKIKLKIKRLTKTIPMLETKKPDNIPLIGKGIIGVDIVKKASIASSNIKETFSSAMSKFMDIQSKDNVISYSLTDGKSLYYSESKAEDDKEFQIFVPANQLVKLNKTVSFDEFGLTADEKMVYVKSKNMLVFSRLGSKSSIIDLRNGAHHSLVEKKGDYKAVDRKMFLEELSQLIALSLKENGAIRCVLANKDTQTCLYSSEAKIELESVRFDDLKAISFDVLKIHKALGSMTSDNVDLYMNNNLIMFVDDEDNRVLIARMKQPDWWR
jgi:hypothetical protein